MAQAQYARNVKVITPPIAVEATFAEIAARPRANNLTTTREHCKDLWEVPALRYIMKTFVFVVLPFLVGVVALIHYLL